VFSCRQGVNSQGVCLNGTHPTPKINLEPSLNFDVKLAVRFVCGQCYESTSVSVLFPEPERHSCGRCYSNAA
jgi:hypothetical protein